MVSNSSKLPFLECLYRNFFGGGGEVLRKKLVDTENHLLE